MSVKEAILQVHDLSVERRGRLAVEGVSFSLPAESDTALVGPNGAGKSTLVAALLGLLPHASGRVELLGQPLARQWLFAAFCAGSDRLCTPKPCDSRVDSCSVLLSLWALGLTCQGHGLPWRSGKQRTAAVFIGP